MRILFHVNVAGELRAAGTLQSIRVCYFLAKNGADVHLHICTRQASSRRELLDFFGLPDVERLRITFYAQPFRVGTSSRILKAWGALFHARRLVTLLLTREKRDYDVFIARGNRFPAFHALLRRRLGYRVVLELHEVNALHDAIDADLGRRAPEGELEGKAFRASDGVMALSRALLDVARARWGEPRASTVIPSGGEGFTSMPLQEGRALRNVYYVGNVYPLSGVEHAVDAVATLPDTTLTIVGDRGPGDTHHDRLAARIADHGAEHRIRMLGFVDPAKLPAVYAEADILVAPYNRTVRTAYFSSPLKIFEYMHAQRPIVASDFPTIREILTDGVHALLVPPGDASALRTAIRRLIDDPALGRRLAAAAHREAERYTLDRKCRDILAFVDRVAARDDGDVSRVGDSVARSG